MNAPQIFRDCPAALQARVLNARTSINPFTLLATDFLNQFNEVAMTLEMLPDFPEMFAEIQDWQPRGYETYFQQSGFSDSDTIVEAYLAAVRPIRWRFDHEVENLARLTVAGLKALDSVLDAGPTAGTDAAALALSQDIRSHVLKLAGLINVGSESEHRPEPAFSVSEKISGLSQADVDALFD